MKISHLNWLLLSSCGAEGLESGSDEGTKWDFSVSASFIRKHAVVEAFSLTVVIAVQLSFRHHFDISMHGRVQKCV